MATARKGQILRLNTLWAGPHLSKLGMSYYIDNEFPKEEAKKVWEHLTHCMKCRLTIADIARIDRIALGTLPKPPEKTLSELFARLGLKP